MDEFRQAKQAVDDCISRFAQGKFPFHHHPSIGVLVEIPAVLEIIDDLVAESDFISIGTNDFIQYLLAVDRANENVADYYCPGHPAVLRGLAKISKAAIAQNKELSACGEMAHEPEFIPFLLGIGVRYFSVYPQFIPSVQRRISELNMSDAKRYADRLLAESTLKGVHKVMKQLQ